MINLRKKDQATILTLAKKYFHTPVEIWIFGSRINGTSHETSDLDIVIKALDTNTITTEELSEFGNAIKNSDIPILVDYFNWNRIPDSFKENIKKNYEVLSE